MADRGETMDKGIWATWYDLEDQDRTSHLEWLHESYLPSLESDARYLWVAHYQDQEAVVSETGVAGPMAQADQSEAVPAGSQYLLLIGASSPHVFFDPLELSEPSEDVKVREMVDARSNLRHAVFVEEASVGGPDSPTADASSVAAPAIRLGCFQMRTPEDDFEAGRWYAQDRLPHMAKANGCVRSRKLLSVAGWAKHAILYEFTSPEARRNIWNDLKARRNRDPDAFWSIGPKTVHSPGSPTLGERTYPTVAIPQSAD